MPDRNDKPPRPDKSMPRPSHDEVPPEDEQIGILPGKVPSNDPKKPGFPGNQPDLA